MPQVVWPEVGDLCPLTDLGEVPSADVVASRRAPFGAVKMKGDP
jgi:hypothetical protein